MSYIEIEKLQILIELRETKIKEVEEWFKSQLVAVSITKEEHMKNQADTKRLVMSLHLIGSKLNRDHSTIHSSIKKVEDWRSLADQYEGEMIIYKEINAIFDRIMKSENQSINN